MTVRAPAAAFLGLALAALTLARLPDAWASGNALNHVSGAWMALADDLARGTLYRPLHDPTLGFGGTRFFPLAFAAQAALVRAGVPLLLAGELLSLAAAVLAAAGAARFLRAAGHGPLAAAGLGVLVLAGFAGQHALAAARGDLPAAALVPWGMAALVARRGPRPVRAGLLLAFAFAAKPTALAPAAAAAAFLALRGDRRGALLFALALGVGCAAVVAATEVASQGRFLALLSALGTGGLGPGDLLRAPLRLAVRLWADDPAGLALAAAAVAALAFTHGSWDLRGARALAALWLAAALVATLAVLASPGTGVNHLLDVEVPAALVLGTCLRAPARGPVRAAAALAAAAAVATGLFLWRHDRNESRLAALADAVAAAADGPAAPLLSEDPLVPLLAGERPYALDAWMFRLAAERDAALARPLLDGLERGSFRAVVLLHGADAPGADEWFGRQFGPAALAEIRSRWTLRLVAGPYHVYRYDPGVQASARGGR